MGASLWGKISSHQWLKSQSGVLMSSLSRHRGWFLQPRSQRQSLRPYWSHRHLWHRPRYQEQLWWLWRRKRWCPGRLSCANICLYSLHEHTFFHRLAGLQSPSSYLAFLAPIQMPITAGRTRALKCLGSLEPHQQPWVRQYLLPYPVAFLAVLLATSFQAGPSYRVT